MVYRLVPKEATLKLTPIVTSIVGKQFVVAPIDPAVDRP